MDFVDYIEAGSLNRESTDCEDQIKAQKRFVILHMKRAFMKREFCITF